MYAIRTNTESMFQIWKSVTLKDTIKNYAATYHSFNVLCSELIEKHMSIHH